MTVTDKPVEQDANQLRRDAQLAKWGLATKAGFQIVPNVLFRAQSHLDIDAVDVVILLNLSLHWWGPLSLPYPSTVIISERMNVSRRTIERRLESLEKRGFLKRLAPESPTAGKPKVRRFEMKGLVEKLEFAANQGLGQRHFKKRTSELAIAGQVHRVAQLDRAP